MEGWAEVETNWLMTFTQPRMLRANPTPFPSAWKNFALGTVRAGQGTYGTWEYDSEPPLPIEELCGEFQYLGENKPHPNWAESYREQSHVMHQLMLADAASKAVKLPEVFLRFMGNPELHHTFHSVTDCGFVHPDKDTRIRPDPSGEGVHVHFYCDSQSCLLWDLYLNKSGAHCVIARHFDFFEPEPPEPGEEAYKGPRAWFVAPSFEAFLYRIWIENQIWYIEHADFLRGRGELPPPVTPGIQVYIDHYRRSNAARNG